MDDLGGRISYLVLKAGVPVFSVDGEQVGTVVRAMWVQEKDVFDGIVFHTAAGRHDRRFVDGPEVGEIYERGVVLKISAAEVAQLPKPGENPAALSVGPDDLVGSPQGGRLRRAWDALTGKR
ncbi:MAG: hypothetical protein ACTHLH_11035 [Solirubrobacterales bacterium]